MPGGPVVVGCGGVGAVRPGRGVLGDGHGGRYLRTERLCWAGWFGLALSVPFGLALPSHTRAGAGLLIHRPSPYFVMESIFM
ncbi:hypothetical protein SGFS_067110 [Streptomyces graminofaciens]|uniref:Uncharacterized protein n=1 Tax=Streptomyces graminofaciens TaxID=68212 RepID=A0ABM7FGW6_9ACTN|nr:hypothetical protein SGFS_067110 [Streptomyces graminofaciens]